MTGYAEEIIEATHCTPAEAAGVEAYMRLERGTLDNLRLREFNVLARECLIEVRIAPEFAAKLAESYGIEEGS